MTREKAERYWTGIADSLARGERALVIAEDDGGEILGTAQAVWAEAENQPHRADISKMLVRRNARRHGVGALVLAAAERAARDAGRTLLVLDTASPEAERMYARGGWQRVGAVPKFALMPEAAETRPPHSLICEYGSYFTGEWRVLTTCRMVSTKPSKPTTVLILARAGAALRS
jgi:GNAT superfamily N-acetyltransferase